MASECDRLDALYQRLAIFLQQRHDIQGLIGEPGETEHVALWKLKCSVARQVERVDLRAAAEASAVFLVYRDRLFVSNPALHVGQNHDTVVAVLGAAEDRLEVGTPSTHALDAFGKR